MASCCEVVPATVFAIAFPFGADPNLVLVHEATVLLVVGAVAAAESVETKAEDSGYDL